MPSCKFLNAPPIDIETDGVHSLAKLDSERKPDITQTNDGDLEILRRRRCRAATVVKVDSAHAAPRINCVKDTSPVELKTPAVLSGTAVGVRRERSRMRVQEGLWRTKSDVAGSKRSDKIERKSDCEWAVSTSCCANGIKPRWKCFYTTDISLSETPAEFRTISTGVGHENLD